MTAPEALQRLAALGKEQTRKTYARHGVTAPMFGVSYGDLEKLRKSIKTDASLAEALWQTRNHDARVLALMIAHPSATSPQQLTAWVKEADHWLQAHAVAQLAAGSPAAKKLMDDWIASPRELVSSSGWIVASLLAGRDESMPDADFSALLKRIESGLKSAPNQTRYCMNGALIAIGRRHPSLQKPALAVAKRIGKVEVDHGDTACKTPDAADCILKPDRSKRGARKG